MAPTRPAPRLRALALLGAACAASARPFPSAPRSAPAPLSSYPGSALQAAVDAAIARGDASLALAPGATYDFASPANRASLTLARAAGLSLDGQGASLVFFPGFGVLVRESRDTALRNLTVAYDPPCFTQGAVVANDAGARTVDVRLDAGFPEPNASAPESGYFGSSEVKLQFWDPAARLRVPGQSPACVVQIVGAVAPRVWRVRNACDVPAGVPGLLATISPRIGATFDIPQFYRGQAWWVHRSANVTTEDVALTGSGNFAVLEFGGEGGHTYRRVTLARAGANLLSSNTDGFHSFSVGRGPLIEACTIAFMGDDALNFHNRVAVVLSAGARMNVVDLSDVPAPEGGAAPPASALADLLPGDALKFMTAQARTPRGTGVVASVARVTDPAVLADARALAASLPGVSVDPAAVGVWALAFSAPPDAATARGDIVQFDRRACAGGVVRDSTFSDAYDGVFRLQARDSTLLNSTWRRTAGGLQIVYDPTWKEGSTDVANVAVLNCSFVDVLHPPATSMQQVVHVDSNVVNLTLAGNTVSAA